MVPISAAYMTVFRRLAISPESSLPLSKIIMISVLHVSMLHVANLVILVDIFQKLSCTCHVYVHLVFGIISVQKFSSCQFHYSVSTQGFQSFIIWLKVN